MRLLILLSLFLLFVAACKHEAIIPSQPVISFQNDVQPILTGNCTEAGCHGSSNTRRFRLFTYNDVMVHGKIVSGNATNSALYNSLSGKKFVSQMPPSSKPPLSDQQITSIYVWIMQGAKNN